MKINALELMSLERVYAKIMSVSMPKQKAFELLNEVDNIIKPLEKIGKLRDEVIKKYQVDGKFPEKDEDVISKANAEIIEIQNTEIEVELSPIDDLILDKVDVSPFELRLLMRLGLTESPSKAKEEKEKKKATK